MLGNPLDINPVEAETAFGMQLANPYEDFGLWRAVRYAKKHLPRTKDFPRSARAACTDYLANKRYHKVRRVERRNLIARLALSHEE